MPLRILFLDDEPKRHKTFARKVGGGHDVTYVWNAHEAKEVLKNQPRFDVYSLDHDLGGRTYVDVSDPNTGSAVARFIAEELPQEKWPDKVVIHSLNYDGSKNMESILLSAGLNAVRFPFIKY